MNSLFDPECHRQVLGNLLEAKEQKGGGRRRKEEELVMQGGPGSVASRASQRGGPQGKGLVNNLTAVTTHRTLTGGPGG